MNKTILISVVFALSACGGGGGGSSASAVPTVSVTGPSQVWSDEYDWSAKATAANMDLNTVGFTISGGDSWVEINSVTGVISLPGETVDAGSHRFTITATDGAGKSASTTWDLQSNAFVAGVWLPSVSDGSFFAVSVTRSGELWSFSNDGVDVEECSGKFTVVGSNLDGQMKCSSTQSDNKSWSANIEGTSDGYGFTLSKMTITSGLYQGEVLNEPSSFYRNQGNTNIKPGIYDFGNNVLNYGVVEVGADGAFESLPSGQTFGLEVSTCEVSGNITTDPIYGLTTQNSEQYTEIDVHDSTLLASNCNADFNQSSAAVLQSFLDNYGDTLVLIGSPGSTTSNDGYNSNGMGMWQICDALGRNTPLGDYYGINCAAPAGRGYAVKKRKDGVTIYRGDMPQ